MRKPKILFFGVDGAMPSYIKEQVAKGNLPGFKKLMEKGVFLDDCMTVFPSVSPTCWNSVYTGALPSVHGAEWESLHVPGTNPWEVITTYHSANTKAERFWETAAKKGYKSLILGGCSAGPAQTDNVDVIGGGVSYTPNKSASQTYVSGRPQQFMYINKRMNKTTLVVTGAKVDGAFFNTTEVDLPQGRELEPNVYEFEALKEKRFYNPDEVEDYSWIVITTPDGVKVGADVESAKTSETIGVGEWTKPITRELMTDDGRTCLFHFRVRLDKMDLEKGEYVVYIPAVKNILKESQTEAYADEIMDIPEVHSVYAGLNGVLDVDIDKYFEVHSFDLEWKKKVLTRSMELHDYDIIFDFISFVDTTNHYFRSFYEGYHKLNNIRLPEDDELVVTAHYVMERCYKLVDEHLSWLLDNVTGEDTYFCVVSDHGAIGQKEVVYIEAVLEKAGLITFTSDKKGAKRIGKDSVDWSKTKAYPNGECHVFVNLEGREPCGAVKPEDYDKVVDEIIDALNNHRKSSDGFHLNAFAVPRDQAGFVGLGGEYSGDVVCGFLGANASGISGVHAQQIPSAKNNTGGDIRALCIMSGKGFKEGISLSRPTDLTDVAPTMCYAAGFPQPKDATGGVIFQAFKEDRLK